MTARKPDPFSLVIFGASGDLTRRKLVPAVFGLFVDGLLPDDFSLIGYARTRQDGPAFVEALHEHVRQNCRVDVWDESRWRDFASRIRYQCGGYDRDGFVALAESLRGSAGGAIGNVLYDFATPAVAFESILAGLDAAGLVQPRGPDSTWSRIIIEKPFGHDLESSCRLNCKVKQTFTEDQVFRIDHYLGKETVQNILVLRFANAIFEPIWNQKYVDHVQITVSETLGMEGRGEYYDQTGALRDIMQNHMMHLLCLVAMEPPIGLDADSIRDEKVKLLRALRPVPSDCMSDRVIRGQYVSASVDGQDVPGYLEEEGVASQSITETYVALKAFVDNWRWAGVPFYLRTGKRMPERSTCVSIYFKPVPEVLFGAETSQQMHPNRLRLRIQPNEGISLRFQTKVPGPGMTLKPHEMEFAYASAYGREPADAYERLLLDAALGDSTLFIRDDEVEAAWRFVAPLLEACPEYLERRLPTYPAGSWGPAEGDELMSCDGLYWDNMRAS